MANIFKNGFFDRKLEKVKRSNVYWKYTDTLKKVMYAHNYTHFWVDRADELTNLMRTKAPDVDNDWYRYQHKEFTLTFSFSDAAIKQYQPIIREFSSFSAAVRILGSYENYFEAIIRATMKTFPEKVKAFSHKYKLKKVNIKNVKNLMSTKLCRGIIFVEQLFDYDANPPYKPLINFFFGMRNVAVHNSNIATEKLCKFAESEFINFDRHLNEGDKVEWSFYHALQLNQFVLQISDEIDTVVCPPLRLKTATDYRHWFLSGKKS